MPLKWFYLIFALWTTDDFILYSKNIDEHELRRSDNVDRPQKAQVIRGDPSALTRAAEAREEDY